MKIKEWITPGIWIGLIFAISSIPNSSIVRTYGVKNNILRFLLSDPVVHAVMFGVLSFLVGHGFRRSFVLLPGKRLILYTFCSTFLFALAVEVYQQLLVPERALEMRDIVFNLVGIGAACGYFLVIFYKSSSMRPHSGKNLSETKQEK